MIDEPPGTFDSRLTMRYTREYPHPIERVWEAVTTAEHLDVWMMPNNKVDARPDGRFGFSFGGPIEETLDGTVAQFDPPRLVEYRFDHGGSMFFELTPIATGCRLEFVHVFTPDFPRAEPGADAYPGSDYPGGDGTPWQPGFTAGFHLCLRDLGTYLGGDGPTLEDTQARIARMVAGDYPAEWLDLIEVYRSHIVATIPPR